MKEYMNYMDNISVDAELHEKIMKRVTKKQEPQRSRALIRYTGLAACAAVLLLCVWAAPGLIDSLTGNPGESQNGDINIIEPGNSQGVIIGTEVDDPDDPKSIAYPLYELTFNTGESLMETNASWAFGCFDYDLTDEQVDAVFPGLNLTMGANAFYGVDGKLLSVTALETLVPGRMDLRAEHATGYTKTEIKLGDGAIVEDCIVVFEDIPQTSEVYGVPVTAYVLDLGSRDGVIFFQSEFMLDNVAYRVKLFDSMDAGKERMTSIVNTLIRNGAADLSVLADPVIPELRFDQLTLAEAHLDSDFGAYIPSAAPDGFVFESSYRVVDTRSDSLSAHWGKENCYIEFRASVPTEYDREHIVSVDEHEKYDMSLYSIPFADSVPSELIEYVNNPVFRVDELTLEIVKARAYWVDGDRGDMPAWRMNFSVLYSGTVVEVSAKGATPEQIWAMLSEIQ